MEDRWGKLALEAHISGALNFSEFRRYDRYWIIREQHVFDALEDRLAIEMNRLVHTWNAGAARSNMWDEKGEDFEFHRKEADKAYKAIGRLSLPWYNYWAPEKSLADLWKDFKEVEKDPKFQEWRKLKKEEMRTKVNKAQKEQAAIASVLAKQKERLKDQRQKDVQKRGRHGRLY